jgi:hypothetical protein
MVSSLLVMLGLAVAGFTAYRGMGKDEKPETVA